ncbi:MAG: hypothetical protein NBV68_01700 [Erythrobacter sp.]|uniref:hypothetical protein n=1 Tax=Erythrobacter sp. TaxID=1042 RepID=UPI0025EE85EA|nr:hypothetical protein [Erythrobacter sp.]MCL9998071.1 hypothetical protein [Erythrobacter sp.]
MSAHLADPSTRVDRVSAANSLRAQLNCGGQPIGETARGEQSAAAKAEALSSLDALPWFEPSGPGPGALRAARVPAARERIGLMRHAGLAAALAVLGGGAWYAAGNTAAPPAPAAQQALASQDNTAAPPARIAATDTAAPTGQSTALGTPPAAPLQNLVAEPARSG